MYVYYNAPESAIHNLVIKPIICTHIYNDKCFDKVIQKLNDLDECTNLCNRLDEIYCIRDVNYCNKLLINDECTDHKNNKCNKDKVVKITQILIKLAEKVIKSCDKYKILREMLNFVGRNKSFLINQNKFCKVFYKKYLEFFNGTRLNVEQWDGLMESFIITFIVTDINHLFFNPKTLSCPEGSIYLNQND